MVAIVPKNQEFAFRYKHRPKLICSVLIREWLILLDTIDEEMAFFDFNFVTLSCNNSFDESFPCFSVLTSILAVDDISKILWRIENNNFISVEWSNALCYFFHCELITHIKCGVHGQTGDVSRFDDKKTKNQCCTKGNHISLYILFSFIAPQPVPDNVKEIFLVVATIVIPATRIWIFDDPIISTIGHPEARMNVSPNWTFYLLTKFQITGAGEWHSSIKRHSILAGEPKSCDDSPY
mmetsp:Transcript_7248/g.9838  ORF Transcript_7248/g.9838 Transcript_7248/m.9838 type:complete len:237 (-) Transcript_7248:204-914(-)